MKLKILEGGLKMEEQISKVPFYKRKAVAIPLVLVFAMVIVSATVAYFHSMQVDLVVSEARSSGDMDVVLSFMSGETDSTTQTIHNAANVALCAELSWAELNNTDGVIYTTNLPQTLTLAPGADTTATVTYTANEITPAGAVTGAIIYTKVACAI